MVLELMGNKIEKNILAFFYVYEFVVNIHSFETGRRTSLRGRFETTSPLPLRRTLTVPSSCSYSTTPDSLD